MTEMEQLKNEADKQKSIQRFDAINEYINSLTERMNAEFAESKKALQIELVSLLVMLIVVAVGFFVKSPWMLFLFFASLMANWQTVLHVKSKFAKLEKTFGEFDGAFTILELLGFLNDSWRDHQKKVVKQSVMEQTWKAAKELVQWRPYGQTATA